LLDGHDAHEIAKLNSGIESPASLDPPSNTVVEAGCYQNDHSDWSCEQGIVQFWDIGVPQPPGRAFVRTSSSVGTTSLSRNGTRLALATCVGTEKVNEVNDRCVDGRVDVFDSATGKPWGKPLVGLTSDVSLAAFDSAGDRLVTISCSRWGVVQIQNCLATQIDLWDVASGTRLRPTLGPPGDAPPAGPLALGRGVHRRPRAVPGDPAARLTVPSSHQQLRGWREPARHHAPASFQGLAGADLVPDRRRPDVRSPHQAS
jgi:hypothetical protein